MFDQEERSPIVTFRLKRNRYGVSTDQVLNMLEMPEVRPVPHAPDCVRGVINLRGEVLPVVDLRQRLGMTTARVEVDSFCALMEQREQDHLNWLRELEASVNERRPFTLATDHRECAFGKWYAGFEATDLAAHSLLRRFDAPHRRIHAVAAKVKKCEAAGDFEGAARIIERTRRKELARMVELFGSLRQHYREEQREQAIILESVDFNYAIAVDEIESVEFLADGEELMQPRGLGPAEAMAIQGLGRVTGQEDLVQILTAESITAGVGLHAMA